MGAGNERLRCGQFREELSPGLDRGRAVDVELDTDAGSSHLYRHDVHDVSPDQERLPLRRDFVTHMAGRVTDDGVRPNAGHDGVRTFEWPPLAGGDVWCGRIARDLEKDLRLGRRFSRNVGRQPEVAVCLRHADFGIAKDAAAVRAIDTADVIGMKMRNEDDVDLIRRIA